MTNIELVNHIFTVVSLLIGMGLVFRKSELIAKVVGRNIYEVHYIQYNGSRAFFQKDNDHIFFEYEDFIIVKGNDKGRIVEVKINNENVVEIHRDQGV